MNADRPTNPFPADPTLVDTLERLLGDHCSHEAVQAAEDDGWAPSIWGPLAAMGAPWVGVSVESGGSGGTWADALAVLRLCGKYAAPVPVAETGILGGWLLGSAGLALPEGPVSVVPNLASDTLALDGGRLHGTAQRVPWATAAEQIVALLDGHIVVADPASARVDVVRNLAGEPRETVHFDGASPLACVAAPPGVDAVALRSRGALSRAAMMTGALERVAAVTVDYANERHQFGKAIATFQAVAQHLVKLTAETQLVMMALSTTTAALSRGEAAYEVAAFKAIAGEGASVVSARSHQSHGAIGMTQEYVLHQLTRRLWSWREEYGSTGFWRAEVGRIAALAGSVGVWRLVTEGSVALAAG